LQAAVIGLTLAACAGGKTPQVPSAAAPTAVSTAILSAVLATDAPIAEGDCRLFPSDNIWNTSIVDAPVDLRSDDYVQSIGLDDAMHPDFGAGEWEGGPIGIPFVEAGSATQRESVAFDYADESDPGPYPIPDEATIEGGADSDGDRHILILDTDECRLYELYDARPGPDGWTAGSGAIFNLRSNDLRPTGWTSADAAGLPILPGLVRFEEVAAGEIRHALRFTAPRTQRAYVWPARHSASDLTDRALPPMGQRFRLRREFDVAGFSPGVQVILRALQDYGMMLADNGSPWFLSGVPDDRWNNEILRELDRVRGRDFEAVDVSGLTVDLESAQASP
jgi:hypothetical protein